MKEGESDVLDKDELLDAMGHMQNELQEVVSIVESIGSDFVSQVERSRQKEHRINKIKLEFRNQADVLEALEQENQNLLDQSEVDRFKLTELINENEEVSEKIEKMELELKEKLESMGKEKAEAESEQEKLDIKLKAAEKKNKWLWTTIEKFKAEKKKLKARIKELEAEKKEALMAIEQSEIVENPGQLLDVTPALPVMQSQIVESNQTKKATEELQERITAKELEIEGLNKRIGELKKSLTALGKQNEEKDNEIEELKISLDESESMELTANLKFEYFQEKLNNKEHEIAELERIVEMEKSRYSALELKYNETEEKYKKAKAEATKQLLMPRVSIVKARGKDFMRKSTIPAKRMDNRMVDESPRVVGRGRANTMFKDLSQAQPSLAEMVLNKIEEKSETSSPQKSTQPKQNLKEEEEPKVIVEETKVEEKPSPIQDNFEIQEVSEEQNRSTEMKLSDQQPESDTTQAKRPSIGYLNSK